MRKKLQTDSCSRLGAGTNGGTGSMVEAREQAAVLSGLEQPGLQK